MKIRVSDKKVIGTVQIGKNLTWDLIWNHSLKDTNFIQIFIV